MTNPKVNISKSAKKFLQEKGIEDVTFNLIEANVAGCCVGIVKEIQPVYKAPGNAAAYRYFQVDGHHVFVARKIKISNLLTLATEGIWNKRLCLDGAIVPI